MQPIANLLRIKLDVHDVPHLSWANQLTFSVPQNLGALLNACVADNRLTEFAANQISKQFTEAVLLDIRLRAAFTHIQPMSSRLPVNYQFIPSMIRDWVAKFIGRMKRGQIKQWAQFPSWPLDLSADFVADLGQQPSVVFKDKTPVLLTHDLDSPEGLTNSVRYFLEMEEAVGARSANYIVPQAWPIDHGLLNALFQRGHEVGIHGFDHSNKTPFLSRSEQQCRLEKSLPLINQYEITGYRAPSLLRTKNLLRSLAHIYRYDSSIPTSGGAFPVPNNGCATARPFKVEGIWELPLSMPRDGSLLFLGYSPQKILQLWIECAELIARSGGIVNLLTHCEYRFSGKKIMRDIYKHFLNYLAQSGQFKFVLPNDIVNDLQKTEHAHHSVSTLTI